MSPLLVKKKVKRPSVWLTLSDEWAAALFSKTFSPVSVSWQQCRRRFIPISTQPHNLMWSRVDQVLRRKSQSPWRPPLTWDFFLVFDKVNRWSVKSGSPRPPRYGPAPSFLPLQHPIDTRRQKLCRAALHSLRRYSFFMMLLERAVKCQDLYKVNISPNVTERVEGVKLLFFSALFFTVRPVKTPHWVISPPAAVSAGFFSFCDRIGFGF